MTNFCDLSMSALNSRIFHDCMNLDSCPIYGSQKTPSQTKPCILEERLSFSQHEFTATVLKFVIVHSNLIDKKIKPPNANKHNPNQIAE